MVEHYIANDGNEDVLGFDVLGVFHRRFVREAQTAIHG
jgi:hypothetical protein